MIEVEKDVGYFHGVKIKLFRKIKFLIMLYLKIFRKGLILMKISLLSRKHFSNDDRIYHHFAKSLSKKGHEVEIISRKRESSSNNDISFSYLNDKYVSWNSKNIIISDKLSKFKPDLILCFDPISVLNAFSYSKDTKIIYDITEWYPSKKELRNHFILLTPFFFVIYLVVFIKACFHANAFIFGEFYKSVIPKKLFPKKRISS